MKNKWNSNWKEKFEKSSDLHKKINFSFFSTLQTLVIVLTDFWFLSYISRYVILKISDFQISRFLPRFLKEFLKEMRQNIWKSDFRWTSNWCRNRASWWILMEQMKGLGFVFHNFLELLIFIYFSMFYSCLNIAQIRIFQIRYLNPRNFEVTVFKVL